MVVTLYHHKLNDPLDVEFEIDLGPGAGPRRRAEGKGAGPCVEGWCADIFPDSPNTQQKSTTSPVEILAEILSEMCTKSVLSPKLRFLQ